MRPFKKGKVSVDDYNDAKHACEFFLGREKETSRGRSAVSIFRRTADLIRFFEVQLQFVIYYVWTPKVKWSSK